MTTKGRTSRHPRGSSGRRAPIGERHTRAEHAALKETIPPRTHTPAQIAALMRSGSTLGYAYWSRDTAEGRQADHLLLWGDAWRTYRLWCRAQQLESEAHTGGR